MLRRSTARVPCQSTRHLLSDPDARYTDLGPGFFDQRINPERRKRAHVRQLEALGYKVTLEPAA